MIRPLASLRFDCSFIIFSKNYFLPLLSSFTDFKLAHMHLSEKFFLIETSLNFLIYMRSLMICFWSFVSALSLQYHIYISSLCLAQLNLTHTLRFKKRIFKLFSEFSNRTGVRLSSIFYPPIKLPIISKKLIWDVKLRGYLNCITLQLVPRKFDDTKFPSSQF